ncbi:MAG: DUF202 domain-containing protein [PVC group bacterium]
MEEHGKIRHFSLADVRDHLAADRTILANERTLLAYLRLSLTLFVVGVSFIKFFQNTVLIITGCFFLPLALLAGIAGVRRYRRCREFLLTLKEGERETVPCPPRRTAGDEEGSGAETDEAGPA